MLSCSKKNETKLLPDLDVGEDAEALVPVGAGRKLIWESSSMGESIYKRLQFGDSFA
jgi:hypothetical protein